jgi:hypothetical protein
LWNVTENLLKDANFQPPIFPEKSGVLPTNYVLDGMQRLSALYGSFHYIEGLSDPKFDIWFNLDEGYFLHRSDFQQDEFDVSIPIRAVNDPNELVDHHQRFARNDANRYLVSRTTDLLARMQEYMIPLVTIAREDILSVVEIFERVNNTATKLNTVDFMRAITWSNDFDLNGELATINGALEESGFAVSEQTLTKMLGMELGRSPMAEDLLRLREENSENLIYAAHAVRERMLQVREFCAEHLSTFSAEYIPYEGQLLVIYNALRSREIEDPAVAHKLAGWYWATSFNEALRGKPDHYVARAVRSLQKLLDGSVKGVEPRLRVTPEVFLERRFIKGKALSAAFAAMFAQNGASSILDGNMIEPRSYMTEFSPTHFGGILKVDELAVAFPERQTTTKILANLFVAGEGEAAFADRDGVVREALGSGDLNDELLASQFLDRQCLDLLKGERWREFLERRAGFMIAKAHQMVGD